MKLKYTDRALEDIDRGVEWYENQRKGLGFEFLDCVEAAIKAILRFPTIYPKPHEAHHRYLIRRFPFSVFYTVEDHIIVIHSVFDNRQDPDKLP